MHQNIRILRAAGNSESGGRTRMIPALARMVRTRGWQAAVLSGDETTNAARLHMMERIEQSLVLQEMLAVHEGLGRATTAWRKCGL